METVKFSAKRFKDADGIKVRFAIRGNIVKAGISAEVKSAGFELTEDVANTYYAWAKTSSEADIIQSVIKPLIASGKVSV